MSFSAKITMACIVTAVVFSGVVRLATLTVYSGPANTAHADEADKPKRILEEEMDAVEVVDFTTVVGAKIDSGSGVEEEPVNSQASDIARQLDAMRAELMALREQSRQTAVLEQMNAALRDIQQRLGAHDELLVELADGMAELQPAGVDGGYEDDGEQED